MAKWGISGKKQASMKNLHTAVTPLPENVKSAFLIAAKKGPIKQGTWNGCAFNAAGKEVDKTVNVNSHALAASIFKCDQSLVGNFISAWDSHIALPGSTATADLIFCLTTKYVEQEDHRGKVVRIPVFESTMKGIADKFDAGTFSEAELEALCPTEFLELVSA